MQKVFRVLIVDDEKIWANFCAKELRKLSDVVVEVSNSVSDALRRIEEALFDVLYCDFKMPYEDKEGEVVYEGGNIVSLRAKSCLPQVKTVMITAYGSTELTRKSLIENGFDDYIDKKDPDKDVDAMKKFLRDVIQNWENPTISANPFQVQRGLAPTYRVPRFFQGRKDFEFLVEQLKTAERGKQSRFLIYGRVGAGKSCLLNHFRNYLQRKGNLVSIYEFPPSLRNVGSDFRDGVSELLSGIARGFKMETPTLPNFLKRIQMLGGSVEVLGFKVQLDWKNRELPPETVLREGLEGLLEDLYRKTETVTMLLDNISTGGALPETAGCFARVMSDPRFIDKGVVVGASALERETTEGSKGINLDPDLGRFFAGKLLRLQNFSNDQCHELCFQTLAGTGVTFNRILINRVYEFSQGHPFICQLLFSYLYEHQIRGLVEEGAFESALRYCLVELMAFFRDFFNELSQEDQTILELMAASGGCMKLSDLQASLAKKNAFELAHRAPALLSSMVKGEILRNLGGDNYGIDFS